MTTSSAKIFYEKLKITLEVNFAFMFTDLAERKMWFLDRRNWKEENVCGRQRERESKGSVECAVRSRFLCLNLFWRRKNVVFPNYLLREVYFFLPFDLLAYLKFQKKNSSVVWSMIKCTKAFHPLVWNWKTKEPERKWGRKKRWGVLEFGSHHLGPYHACWKHVNWKHAVTFAVKTIDKSLN